MSPNDDIRPPRPALPPRKLVTESARRTYAFPSSRPLVDPSPTAEPVEAPLPAVEQPNPESTQTRAAARVKKIASNLRLPRLTMSKKQMIIATSIVVIVLLLGLLVIVLSMFNSHKTEKDLGSDYIVAVQSSDYKKLDKYIYQPMKEVVEKLEVANKGKFTKADGYESILTKSGQVGFVGKEKVKSPKVIAASSGGGAKHVVISYKVGDKYVSVYEVYDSSGKPYVLTMKDGNNPVSDEEFKSEYDAINKDIALINTLLNQSNNLDQDSTNQSSSSIKLN